VTEVDLDDCADLLSEWEVGEGDVADRRSARGPDDAERFDLRDDGV
jgi:hypothetical protein